MEFLINHRDFFRVTAIFSSLFFNFVLIYASWTGEYAAWVTTIFVASVAVVSAFICELTSFYQHFKNRIKANSSVEL